MAFYIKPQAFNKGVPAFAGMTVTMMFSFYKASNFYIKPLAVNKGVPAFAGMTAAIRNGAFS